MYEKFHKTDKNLKICIGRKATLRYDNKNITDNRRTRTDKKESSEGTEAGRVLYLKNLWSRGKWEKEMHSNPVWDFF